MAKSRIVNTTGAESCFASLVLGCILITFGLVGAMVVGVSIESHCVVKLSRPYGN